MSAIEEYVNQFDGLRREWIEEYTNYMKEKHPEMEGVIWFRMPTYKVGCSYIAFSVTKAYFAIHTNDNECFQMLKSGLDKAAFGKRSAKVKYTDDGAKHVIYNAIEFFAFHSKSEPEEQEESHDVIPFPKMD